MYLRGSTKPWQGCNKEGSQALAPNRYFRASYDRTTKIITGLVCATPLIVAVAIRNTIPAAILIFVVAIGYAYSARVHGIGAGDYREPDDREGPDFAGRAA